MILRASEFAKVCAIRFVFHVRSMEAVFDAENPNFAHASNTFCLVVSDMRSRPLIARDTVAAETPASLATS
mgnify:CR=1 FL=1